MGEANQHFPKWLLLERFEIVHCLTPAGPFSVTLFDKVSARYVGYGRNITVAAKAALKQREAR